MSQNLLHQFLDKTLATYIDASILRVSMTGVPDYTYSLRADEVKAGTSLKRLHLGTVAAYLRTFNVSAEYNKKFDFFTVAFDLNHVSLTLAQTDALSLAIQTYKVNQKRKGQS